MRKIEIIGNLTKKPEMRQTNTGKDVCSFDVAVYVSPEQSDFYRVSAWGKQGESCYKWLDKGKKVYVRGDLSVSTYVSHDQTRVQLNISASEVEFLSPKEKETATVSQGKVTQEEPDTFAGFTDINSDDLPF
jgi:single-strand DNA-binding protein